MTRLTYGGLYVQRTFGLLDCQIDIDTPPYGVVTSLLVLARTCLAEISTILLVLPRPQTGQKPSCTTTSTTCCTWISFEAL